jgi:hypothetical protein
MTRSATTSSGPAGQRARTGASRIVVGGLVVTAAYFSLLSLTRSVFALFGDLPSFLYLATWAIPLCSIAIAAGLQAARSPRPVTRVAAGLACGTLTLLTVFVVRVVWTFTMTDWLVW